MAVVIHLDHVQRVAVKDDFDFRVLIRTAAIELKKLLETVIMGEVFELVHCTGGEAPSSPQVKI